MRRQAVCAARSAQRRTSESKPPPWALALAPTPTASATAQSWGWGHSKQKLRPLVCLPIAHLAETPFGFLASTFLPRHGHTR
jgi:hypothetical protein